MKKTIIYLLVMMMFFSMTIGIFANESIEKKHQKSANNSSESIVDKFSDMEGHWAIEWVEILEDLGGITGYTDGTFRPDDHITIAEFTKVVTTILYHDPGINDKGYVNHWSDYYRMIASDNGFLETGDPDRYITRGEIGRMLIRASDLEYPSNFEAYRRQITDFSRVFQGMREYVLKAYASGIISGYPDGTFRYEDPATRAEASTMVVRMLYEDKREIPELEEFDEELDEDAFIEPEFEIIERGHYGVFLPAVLISNYHDYNERYSFRGYFHSPEELNVATRRNVMDFYNDDAIFTVDSKERVFQEYMPGQPNNQWNTIIGMYNTESDIHISPEIKMADIGIVEFKIEIKKETEDGEIIREYIVSAPVNVE